MNNLELQGATAAPPFHGATVTLAAADKFLEGKNIPEKRRSNRTLKTGLISTRNCFLFFFLTKCLIFQGEKNRSIFLTGVNCTAFFFAGPDKSNQLIHLYVSWWFCWLSKF